jgi:hypothetical protein
LEAPEDDVAISAADVAHLPAPRSRMEDLIVPKRKDLLFIEPSLLFRPELSILRRRMDAILAHFHCRMPLHGRVEML